MTPLAPEGGLRGSTGTFSALTPKLSHQHFIFSLTILPLQVKRPQRPPKTPLSQKSAFGGTHWPKHNSGGREP